MTVVPDIALMLGMLFVLVLYMGVGVKCGQRFEDTDNPVNLDIVLMLWALMWPLMLITAGMVYVVRRILRLDR